ncbi:MAG: TolC family outer membrane protein [Rhodobacteraceae bacterium]|nr:TolC family outer membrane protein [Paracoccaceae bacterium]
MIVAIAPPPLFWLALPLAVLCAGAQLAQADSSTGADSRHSLGDALAMAYNHSGLLEQNRALLRAADEDVAAAYAILRPLIAWSASASHDHSRRSSALSGNRVTSNDTTPINLGLNLELLLYDGGGARRAVDAAQEVVLATRQRLISIEQSVLLAAVQAFMAVRRDTELVQLRENNLRLLEQELRATRDRFEVGELTRTDVSLAEAALEGARAELAMATGDLASSQEAYLAAVGNRPDSLEVPQQLPQLAASLDDAKAAALARHPDLVRAQHDIRAAEFTIERARAQLRPTLRLNSRLSAQDDTKRPDYSLGGTLSLDLTQPIYRGGQLSATLRRTMQQRDAARGNLHLVRHAIEQQVGIAWAQLAATQAQRSASEEQVRAQRLAYEGVSEETALGARTILDVLNAEQDLLQAEVRYINTISDEYVAAYALLATMGLLTVEHLGLQVEQYDPATYYEQVREAPAIGSARGRQLDQMLRRIGK